MLPVTGQQRQQPRRTKRSCCGLRVSATHACRDENSEPSKLEKHVWRNSCFHVRSTRRDAVSAVSSQDQHARTRSKSGNRPHNDGKEQERDPKAHLFRGHSSKQKKTDSLADHCQSSPLFVQSNSSPFKSKSSQVQINSVLFYSI